MNIAHVVVRRTTGQLSMRERIPAGIVGATVTVSYADPLWERLEKKVVFRVGELTKFADRFDGTTAVIPAEVIAEPGTVLYFGIWGYDPEGVLQLPLIEVRLGQTERAAQPGSDPDADPGLPIWAQLQEELDSLRNQVENDSGGGLSFSVVSELPTENISTSTIYLVKDAEADGNIYTEYLYINGAWEIVGSQQLDLTGYATEAWVEEKLEEHSGGNVDLGMTGATVGQTVRISAVDENGVPTAWLPTDFPSGGSGGGDVWEEITNITLTEDVTSVNLQLGNDGKKFSLKKAYLKFNPRYKADEKITTSNIRVSISTGDMIIEPLNDTRTQSLLFYMDEVQMLQSTHYDDTVGSKSYHISTARLDRMNKGKPITSFNFWNSTYYTGSVFTLWGVRA